MRNLLHDFFNSKSDASPLEATQQEQLEKDFQEWHLNEGTKDFETSAMPLIKHLAEEHHPHHVAIVTSTRAELHEGKQSTKEILDFIVD